MKKDITRAKNLMTKFGLLGATMLLGVIVAIPQAHAESPNILTGQNLTIGSTGQGVVVLQGLLQELGHMTIPFGTPMGYYGPLTRAGVASYQASQSVSPAVGYFGPLTKVTMHQHFMPKGWLTLLGW